MKKGKIGEFLYPSDNSYSKNLTNIMKKEDILLAGNTYKKPKLVEVISEPYISTVSFLEKTHELEFINVKFEGEIFRVLNWFFDNLEERNSTQEVTDYLDAMFSTPYEGSLFSPNRYVSDNSKGADSVLVNQNSK